MTLYNHLTIPIPAPDNFSPTRNCSLVDLPLCQTCQKNQATIIEFKTGAGGKARRHNVCQSCHDKRTPPSLHKHRKGK